MVILESPSYVMSQHAALNIVESDVTEMAFVREGKPVHSALAIAGTYALLSVLWILYSDAIVATTSVAQLSTTEIQSLKGVAFVVASSILIYGLVYSTSTRLTVRNQRLQAALQQAGLLHRIARHNIRTSCNVIQGHAELLATEHDHTEPRQLDAIRSHNQKLLNLSEKSRVLRDFLDPTDAELERLDMGELVESQVVIVRDRHPHADVSVQVPDAAPVTGHFHLETAIRELLENAILHNQQAESTVAVAVTATTQSVTVRIADDGPGFPKMEASVLETGAEKPMLHSSGLGLWIVRLAVTYSGGSVRLETTETHGSTIQITLPAA